MSENGSKGLLNSSSVTWWVFENLVLSMFLNAIDVSDKTLFYADIP
jgi:hypothetical protein